MTFSGCVVKRGAQVRSKSTFTHSDIGRTEKRRMILLPYDLLFTLGRFYTHRIAVLLKE
jgi:hypothetical protein